jgi:hypothetical protein
MKQTLGPVLLLATFLITATAQIANPQNAGNGEINQQTKERIADQRETTHGPSSSLTKREQELLNRIENLERRLAELEERDRTNPTNGLAQPAATPPMPDMPGMPAKRERPMTAAEQEQEKQAEEQSVLDFFRDTSINVLVDGYYAYNFNRPIGRTNMLRAYDVSSNSFSLNQAALIIERAPDVEAGRRFGVRLDLQYGQATETLQGNPFNELRPHVYRPVWQAYGTYIAPVGKGLTVDLGKFAGMLGYESNYTKDNINYSRSYLFNFLPFYHSGLRFKYPINDKVTLMYHFVNGANQTEDFNRFKSQHVAVMVMPTKRFMWQLNYYFGREQREILPDAGSEALNLLTNDPASCMGMMSDMSADAVGETTITPRGRLHIFDTYASWNVTDKLTLAAEADYVVNRVESFSSPSRIVGAAGYVRYYVTPKFALAGRAEYLRDNGGLFSGMTQSLKETTVTADYNAAEGFLIRGEWRRDSSNHDFFPTRSTGVFKRDQNTLTVGLIFWLGRKKGLW